MNVQAFNLAALQQGCDVALVAPDGRIWDPWYGRHGAEPLDELPVDADGRIEQPDGLFHGYQLVRHGGQLTHDFFNCTPYKIAC